MPPPETATLVQASARLDEALVTIAYPARRDLRLADYAAAMQQVARASMPIDERAALTYAWRLRHAAALEHQELN